MMTPAELKRFIRFGLATLRSQNAHHEFERLSTAIAQARISRNIIPATGPVGAGGDQGRDAESVPRLDGASGEAGLLGDLSSLTVVLACTLQTDSDNSSAKVRRKILDDVGQIVSHDGLQVDVVVAFCENDIPVGVRNGIKKTAKQEHAVDVHILDGNAIAELLTAPDLNWVAHKYLDLPREAVPSARTDEADAWYHDQRTKWAERPPTVTWGDLEDLRQSVRHAYQHGYTADVEFWLELLKELNDAAVPEPLRRAAVYEIAVANLRGLETLEPVAADLDWFFDTVTQAMPSSELQDAQVLLQFCFGAAARGFAGVILEQVERWRRELEGHVDSAIEQTDNPARLYSLLLTRGALELITPEVPTFDVVAEWWNRALDHADEATMLPADLAADRLPPLAPIYSDAPEFREFARRVDELAATQGGQAVAADQAVNRAASLLRAEQWTAALPELHRAKQRFLEARETGRLLSSLILIGETYGRLGLLLAAKHYFLATASIAINSPDRTHGRYVALGLASAADCDYQTGAWLGFLDLAGTATNAHGLLDIDPGDLDEHPFLAPLMLNSATAAIAADLHYPAVRDDALALARAHVPSEQLDEWLDDPPQHLADRDQFVASVAEQLHTRPFDDAGSTRTLSWSADGVSWTVHTGAGTDERSATERFVAMLQVLQADLADRDLVTLPMALTIRVTVGEPAISETGPSELSLTVPAWDADVDDDHEAMQQISLETSFLAFSVLRRTSTLPDDELAAILESRVEADLANKVTIFRMYDQMIEMWSSPTPDGLPEPPSKAPPPGPEHEQLSWLAGPGPGYTAEAAQEALENRYRNLTKLTSATRAELVQDQAFVETVEELRRRGWLDWQILGAVHSVALTYRSTRDVQTGRTTFQAIQKFRIEEERTDDPVPESEFTLEALERSHYMNALSTLTSTWKRTLRFQFPPLDAVERLLAERYGHYDDDIEHPDPFVP